MVYTVELVEQTVGLEEQLHDLRLRGSWSRSIILRLPEGVRCLSCVSRRAEVALAAMPPARSRRLLATPYLG